MKYSDKQVRGGMAVERQWRGVGGEHSLMATHTHTHGSFTPFGRLSLIHLINPREKGRKSSLLLHDDLVAE